MNVVKEINAINDRELDIGSHGASWHDQYKDSAYVFIGGLNMDMTEGDVITVFSQYGEVMDVNLPRDKTTGKQRGFGFLMYEDQRSTVLAVDNLNGAQVLGRTLRVDHVQNYKQPKTKGEDGEMADAVEQSLNAKPQMIHDDAEESDDGSVSTAPSIDPEDPMASYLLQKHREEKARSKGKEKDKPKRKRDRANETPEERRARKERKRARREAKEGKGDRDRHGADVRRRDHSRERKIHEKDGSRERKDSDRRGRERSEHDRPRRSSRSPRSFATIMPGSYAADRWGRKGVLCSTLIGTAVGLTFFGSSRTLTALIFFRCVGYALGPQLGWATVVTILGDVSDSSNRGIAFSAVNAAYRVGQFFSPIFASVLAHPKNRYGWFQSEFWERHPYALPCWAGATTCILASYITMCCVPETAPSMVDPKLEEFLEEAFISNPHTKDLIPEPTLPHINDETAPAQMIAATMEPVAHNLHARPRVGVFTPHIIQLLISSWIMYFMTMGFFALFPLWAFTPVSSGGLGASEVAIGSFISARAIAQFVVLIPYAYFETRLGVYRLYAYSLTVYTISGTIGFPLLNALAKWDGITSLRFNMVIVAYFILVGGSTT
ncbi:unnamed protein product [Rhizoctonia solani]|uniref:RRM domain-containing protein n=1 Tax=Rhizoctonia solani TaxID=456999 RepID=A0A8H3AWY2_9AGAM|nr:unnamed protein product [Rhizoctonia solani]